MQMSSAWLWVLSESFSSNTDSTLHPLLNRHAEVSGPPKLQAKDSPVRAAPTSCFLQSPQHSRAKAPCLTAIGNLPIS